MWHDLQRSWDFLKEGGSTDLEVPTRNKRDHLSHPLDLWDIREKKHTIILEATGDAVSTRVTRFQLE